MNRWNGVFLKTVRWTGWLILPVVFGFLITGYTISGRYGLDALMDERTALAWHRLFHGPLWILLLAHVLPAVYLALQRWGWIHSRTTR